MRPPQRLSRALPDEPSTSSAAPARAELEPDPITTARRPPAASTEVDTPIAPDPTTTLEEGTGSSRSVMREWVNELTGRAERASTGIRVPSEAEISQVMSMFPDVQRDVVVGALQRRYVSVPGSLLLAIVSSRSYQLQYRGRSRDFTARGLKLLA